MIIDVHIHAKPGAGRQTVSILREEFRRNGVALGLINSLGTWSRYPVPKEIRAANEEARELAGISGGMLRWMAYINPQNANWRKEIDHCLAGGAVGIKLWVALKDKHGKPTNTEHVLEHAGRLNLPVLIHTYNRTADPNLPGEITLTEFMQLAKRHRQTRMIAAHVGHNWPAETGLYRPLPNTWFDICGGYPAKGQLEVLVREMGADRILFASDWPCRSPASQLSKVMLANISKTQKNKILCRNAIKVFELKDVKASEASLPKAAFCPTDETEDHFCFCGQWPFFKTESQTPRALEDVLAKAGVKSAYTADLGSIYRQDLSAANESFLAACRGLKRVKPLAVINPRVHDYRHVLENISRKFAGIILFPNLHVWNLSDPQYAVLFRRCRQNGIKIWINCQLGDDRLRHAGTTVRSVSDNELLSLADSTETPPVIFQGVSEGAVDAFLKRHGNDRRFKFEISRLTDTPGALRRIFEKHGSKRLVMGSEYPFRDMAQVRWTSQRL